MFIRNPKIRKATYDILDFAVPRAYEAFIRVLLFREWLAERGDASEDMREDTSPNAAGEESCICCNI